MHVCNGCRIEGFTAPDGRKGEKHSYADPAGNQIVDTLIIEPQLLSRQSTFCRPQSLARLDAGPIVPAPELLTRELIIEAVKEAVTSVLTAFIVEYEPMAVVDVPKALPAPEPPAQSTVEQMPADPLIINLTMVAIVVAQAAVFGYVFFWM